MSLDSITEDSKTALAIIILVINIFSVLTVVGTWIHAFYQQFDEIQEELQEVTGSTEEIFRSISENISVICCSLCDSWDTRHHRCWLWAASKEEEEAAEDPVDEGMTMYMALEDKAEPTRRQTSIF